MPRIDDNFAKLVSICTLCEGRIIVIGVGKSGHIAKIAATLQAREAPHFYSSARQTRDWHDYP